MTCAKTQSSKLTVTEKIKFKTTIQAINTCMYVNNKDMTPTKKQKQTNKSVLQNTNIDKICLRISSHVYLLIDCKNIYVFAINQKANTSGLNIDKKC